MKDTAGKMNTFGSLLDREVIKYYPVATRKTQLCNNLPTLSDQEYLTASLNFMPGQSIKPPRRLINEPQF